MIAQFNSSYYSYTKNYMNQEVQDSILCNICFDILLTPAQLSCKHIFCCFCIRQMKYKGVESTITCPLCRKKEKPQSLNKQKGLQVISQILKQKSDFRIFYGSAQTINHIDKNLTVSQPFFFLLKGNRLHGDIIWGEGTQHSSYLLEVGRVSGLVQVSQNKDKISFKDLKCEYSNSPYELWNGQLVFKGNRKYSAEKSIYKWFGWGRQTSGDLAIEVKELDRLKSLEEQLKE